MAWAVRSLASLNTAPTRGARHASIVSEKWRWAASRVLQQGTEAEESMHVQGRGDDDPGMNTICCGKEKTNAAGTMSHRTPDVRAVA